MLVGFGSVHVPLQADFGEIVKNKDVVVNCLGEEDGSGCVVDFRQKVQVGDSLQLRDLAAIGRFHDDEVPDVLSATDTQVDTSGLMLAGGSNQD